MPTSVEILVGIFVVLGLVAILARFAWRDPSGEIRLPGVIDESVGMYALRQVRDRVLGSPGDPPPTQAGPPASRPVTAADAHPTGFLTADPRWFATTPERLFAAGILRAIPLAPAPDPGIAAASGPAGPRAASGSTDGAITEASFDRASVAAGSSAPSDHASRPPGPTPSLASASGPATLVGPTPLAPTIAMSRDIGDT